MCQPFYSVNSNNVISVYTSASLEHRRKCRKINGSQSLLGMYTFVCKAGKTGSKQV